VKPVGDVLSLAPQSVSPDPTKTAATNEHRSERSEQSDRAPVRERLMPRCASVGGRAEECRSDQRNGGRASETKLTRLASRCAGRDERLSISARARAQPQEK
jgi:hypothetical protein